MQRISEQRGAYLNEVMLREGGGDVEFAIPYLDLTMTNWVRCA